MKAKESYYKIAMQGGHNSHKHATNELTFYIKAKSLQDAIKTAYKMPMVRHNSNKGIISAQEISYEEYRANFGHAYDMCRGARFNRKYRNMQERKKI